MGNFEKDRDEYPLQMEEGEEVRAKTRANLLSRHPASNWMDPEQINGVHY